MVGFTRSQPGHWTSWPPHEHTTLAEELYVYFDMPPPAFGIQLVYTRPEAPELAAIVREGDAVLMPAGYHPNVVGARTRHQLHLDDGRAARGRRPPVRRRQRSAGLRQGRLRSRGEPEIAVVVRRPWRRTHFVSTGFGRSSPAPERESVPRWPWRSLKPAPTSPATATGTRRPRPPRASRRSSRRAVVIEGDLGPGGDRDASWSTRRSPALGGIDILVNNAGIIRRAPAAESTDDDWQAVLDVNLTRSTACARPPAGACWPAGAARSSTSRRCSPSRAASTSRRTPRRRAPSPSSPRRWRTSGRARGVNVNAIAPGYIRTDNTAALIANETRNRQILERIPAGRWGEPADLGGAVVFLASRASDYVSGHVLVVDGGWLGR